MIYDPVNIKIAMDEQGRLYHVRVMHTDADGNPVPEWAPMVARNSNEKGGFRWPEW